MPVPLRGDRSAWDINYSNLHASDIENNLFKHHVPNPEYIEGAMIHSSGSDGWVANDEITIPLSILEQTSTPSTPDVGYIKFYAKTDHKFYILDSNGNETELVSASASYVLLVDDNMDILYDDNGDLLYEG